MPLPEPVPPLGSLDLLVTVARTSSLRRAAEQHAISQPAASQRLQHLERVLGLQLLERGPRGSALTTAGTAIVRWAEDILDATRTLLVGAEALRTQGSKELRVAASMTVAEYLMPSWLIQLRVERPGIQASLVVENSEHVAEMVRDGSVELGFIETPRSVRGLRTREVGGDKLAVVVAPGHPWSKRRSPISPEHLASTPLLMREQGSGTRDALEAALASLPQRSDPLMELASTAALLGATATGAGPAVVSELAAAREIAEGRLVAVPVRGLAMKRTFRAVWAPRHEPTGLAAALIRIASSSGR